jgi:hypothetical protein
MGSVTIPVAAPADAVGAPPAPTGPPADTTPSPGAQQGSGAPPPGASPESPNLRQLREQYETTKGELSEWSKLGSREEVAAAKEAYTNLQTQALEVGKTLGYNEQDIIDSFKSDPNGTIRFLINKQAEADKNPDAQFEKKFLTRAEYEKAQESVKIEKAGMTYDSEFDRLYKDAFPDGLPPDVQKHLYDIAWVTFTNDRAALDRLVKEGKISDIAKIFAKARETLVKVGTSWNEHERKRVGGKTGEAQPVKAPAKRLTLDEIAENPGLINPKYA